MLGDCAAGMLRLGKALVGTLLIGLPEDTKPVEQSGRHWLCDSLKGANSDMRRLSSTLVAASFGLQKLEKPE